MNVDPVDGTLPGSKELMDCLGIGGVLSHAGREHSGGGNKAAVVR